MEFSRFPQPSPGDVNPLWDQMVAQSGGVSAFRELLSKYGVSEAELREHLLWQVSTLQFIDYRFKPSIQVSENALHRAYEAQRAAWEKQGKQEIPSFDDARAAMETLLIQQRADRALDRWLGDQRTRVEILYHAEAFQ